MFTLIFRNPANNQMLYCDVTERGAFVALAMVDFLELVDVVYEVI